MGGPAKSQLVHEVDALGGEIGKMADRTYVQKRVLNRSKASAQLAAGSLAADLFKLGPNKVRLRDSSLSRTHGLKPRVPPNAVASVVSSRCDHSSICVIGEPLLSAIRIADIRSARRSCLLILCRARRCGR